MQKNLLLQWALAICFIIISQESSARTIILNINNANSDGNLFEKNENVVIGDIIRFTNNLSYTINQQNESFITGPTGNININIAPGGYFDIALTSVSQTQFTFVHSNMAQNKYYNSRINLTYQAAVLGVADAGNNTKEKSIVFPNPCTDILNITSKEGMRGLELYDVTGKLLITKNIDSSKDDINMSSYLKGNFFLRIKNSDGSDSVIHVLKK